MYCKTKHLFGFEGEEEVEMLLCSSDPPPDVYFVVFSVVFPGPSSLSYQGLEVKSPICPNELKANRTSVVFLIDIYLFIYFVFAPPRSAVYRYGFDCTNRSRQQSLFDVKGIYHIHYLQDIKPSLFTCISNR